MRTTISLLGLLFIMNTTATAADHPDHIDRQQIYMLQERCSKKAAEFFKINSHYSGDEYFNHYNAKLNKCFIVITEIGLLEGKKIHLYDINENREYGLFSGNPDHKPDSCQVLGKACNSETEWDTLVKPYLEE